ncbi:MAG: hypothetical protein IPP79_17960 [Chitinophagaceae bacterium]|nr:hypothetical protein [Chitinophagaceae bacterium]
MNPSTGNDFVYIVKLNGIGAISWFKGFGSATGSDYGTDIIELSSGDFAFTGVSDGGLTGKTALLCVINSTGNLVLGNRYSSRNKTDSRFFGVVEAGDTLVVSGDYIFQNNNFGGVVHKINKTTGAIFTTLDYNMDNDGSSENKIFKTGYGYLISSNIVQAQNINTKRIGLLRPRGSRCYHN